MVALTSATPPRGVLVPSACYCGKEFQKFLLGFLVRNNSHHPTDQEAVERVSLAVIFSSLHTGIEK